MAEGRRKLIAVCAVQSGYQLSNGVQLTASGFVPVGARHGGAGHLRRGRNRTASSLRRRERVPSRRRRLTTAAGARHGRDGTDGGSGTAAALVAFHLIAFGRTRTSNGGCVDDRATEHTVLNDSTKIAGKASTCCAQAGRTS